MRSLANVLAEAALSPERRTTTSLLRDRFSEGHPKMAIAANKVDGVRAAPVTDEQSARLSREHNNANVLALGERITPADLARQIVNTFLDTPFAGGRHQRRLDKISALEHPSG